MSFGEAIILFVLAGLVTGSLAGSILLFQKANKLEADYKNAHKAFEKNPSTETNDKERRALVKTGSTLGIRIGAGFLAVLSFALFIGLVMAAIVVFGFKQ